MKEIRRLLVVTLLHSATISQKLHRTETDQSVLFRLETKLPSAETEAALHWVSCHGNQLQGPRECPAAAFMAWQKQIWGENVNVWFVTLSLAAILGILSSENSWSSLCLSLDTSVCKLSWSALCKYLLTNWFSVFFLSCACPVLHMTVKWSRHRCWRGVLLPLLPL